MKKTIALFALLVGALVAMPSLSPAQDSAPAAASKKTAIHGKVAAVDAAAKTITVGAKTYSVTADTKISKEGEAATFADLTVGAAVTGTFKKDSDGKLTATAIKIGAKKKKLQ